MSLGFIEKIPSEWETILLIEVANPKQWKTIATKDLLDDGYTVYGANGKIGFYNKYTHKEPIVMITCRGATCGNIHITEPFSYVNGNGMALDGLIENLYGLKLLYYVLRARGLNDVISGSAQPQITRQGLVNVKIPLPPITEQKIIAEKLDLLLAEAQKTKSRLEQIPELLKQFRQSVLSDAVSGKLTEDWRKNDKCWISAILGNLILDSTNGLSKRKGTNGKEITVLRLADFKNACRVFGNERKIVLTDKEIEKFTLKNGDILVIRVNGSVDLAGRFIEYSLQKKIEGFCDHFIRLRLNEKKILSKYLLFVANNGEGRLYLQNSLSTSAGQNTINQASIRALNIPLPSLEEQNEIVRRVEQLFAYADKIEQQVNTALEKVNHLPQSILAKAFRGELTAQWRAENVDLITGENSAASLLEKIQVERAQNNKNKKKK
ncbi:restriction endonuclease subunit S [Gilliamella sp. CG13]|uniref:restriction endonuclease subunit S n=1 Tax=Gilliamella sp. CG13 TaxID=3351502 RepID=UPI00398662A3